MKKAKAEASKLRMSHQARLRVLTAPLTKQARTTHNKATSTREDAEGPGGGGGGRAMMAQGVVREREKEKRRTAAAVARAVADMQVSRLPWARLSFFPWAALMPIAYERT